MNDKDKEKRYLGLAAMMGLPLESLKKLSTAEPEEKENYDWIDIPEQVLIDRQILLMELRNGWR